VDAGGLHSGGRGSCTGGSKKQSRGGREIEGVQRKKKEGKKSEGLMWKIEKI
jgi:hypothetical protein